MDRRRAMFLGAASAAVSLSGQGQARAAKPRPVSARLPFIDRDDGTRLWLTDWGNGKPLLFVHAAGLNSCSWAYQLTPMLRAGYRCVAYDRRGHGRSSVPGAGYDYDTLSDDLAALVNALDLRGITLVGHSMGCGEIIRYLTRHGAGRVERIVLLAPTLPFFLKTADNPMGLDRAFFEGMRAAWLRDRGERCTQQAAEANLAASLACNFAAYECLQIHAGAGYTDDFHVERLFRDARITEIYECATDIQRLVIARALLAS